MLVNEGPGTTVDLRMFSEGGVLGGRVSVDLGAGEIKQLDSFAAALRAGPSGSREVRARSSSFPRRAERSSRRSPASTTGRTIPSGSRPFRFRRRRRCLSHSEREGSRSTVMVPATFSRVVRQLTTLTRTARRPSPRGAAEECRDAMGIAARWHARPVVRHHALPDRALRHLGSHSVVYADMRHSTASNQRGSRPEII